MGIRKKKSYEESLKMYTNKSHTPERKDLYTRQIEPNIISMLSDNTYATQSLPQSQTNIPISEIEKADPIVHTMNTTAMTFN